MECVGPNGHREKCPGAIFQTSITHNPRQNILEMSRHPIKLREIIKDFGDAGADLLGDFGLLGNGEIGETERQVAVDDGSARV